MKWRWNILLSGLAVIALSGVSRILPRAAAQNSAGSTTGASAPAVATSSGAQTSALPLPMDEIIRQVAQHESDFKAARDNYTYTQEVLVEDVSPNQGEFRQTSDIMFTDAGKRYEYVTYAPAPSLVDFDLSSRKT